jgi:RNA polymerase sigma-70 factor, ECF subfamily
LRAKQALNFLVTKNYTMINKKDKKTNKNITKSIQCIALDFLNDKSENNFKLLIERLKPGLALFVRKYIGSDKETCNEIVFQTFISVWEKIKQYDPTYNFSTWVYAIAKNEALGRLRSNRKTSSYDAMLEQQSKTLKMYSEVFYMDLECIGPNKEELTQHLYYLTIKEINLLREPYKTVMYEREINKLQLPDIAELLKWNLNTVKTRLVKARRDIATNLTKKYPELIDAYNEHEI